MQTLLTTPLAGSSGALVAALPAGSEPGLLALFLEAGPVAKLVLSVLILFSLASWAVMLSKSSQFRKLEKDNARFLDHFRRSARFSEINSVTDQYASAPLVSLFQAGYLEIDTQVKAASAKTGQQAFQIRSMRGIERSLQRAIGVEVQNLSRHSQVLATTAAATPFIGLFGTVWGIMLAFNDIGMSGAASIAVVAPGIAEALINTAAGLVAAIPALIGYNQLAARIRAVKSELEDFALEFLNLAERNFT